MARQIQVNIAVASHLSDAQYLMNAGKVDEANKHINFAKYLIFDHFTTQTTLSEDQLNEIWRNINEKNEA